MYLTININENRNNRAKIHLKPRTFKLRKENMYNTYTPLNASQQPFSKKDAT